MMTNLVKTYIWFRDGPVDLAGEGGVGGGEEFKKEKFLDHQKGIKRFTHATLWKKIAESPYRAPKVLAFGGITVWKIGLKERFRENWLICNLEVLKHSSVSGGSFLLKKT